MSHYSDFYEPEPEGYEHRKQFNNKTMNDQLEHKNIKISSVEDAGWGIKLKDEKTLVYNVPKFKKDKTTRQPTTEKTVAFTYLEGLTGYGMGTDVCVKFVTAQNSQGGESRYVRIISEPQEGGNDPLPVEYQKPMTPSQNAFDNKNKGRDFEAEAYGKCKTLFLVESYKMFYDRSNGEPTKEIEEIEKDAELWATMSMRKLPKSNAETMAEARDSVPTEPVFPEDDIQVENIPF